MQKIFLMDEKNELILKNAGTLFMKYGIRSISMEDIAREMGISKKTLYQYVDNKAELVEQLLLLMIKNVDYQCIMCSTNEMNAIDILLAVSRAVSEEMKGLNQSLVFELQKFYPAIYRDFILKKRDHVFEQIKRNFEQGITQGLYRDDLAIDLVSRLYVQKLIDMHDPEFLSSGNFTFEKIFQVMFDNHIRGIANANGLAYYENQIKNLNLNTNP